MKATSQRSLLLKVLAALLVVAGVAATLMVLSRDHFRRQEAASRQQAAADVIRRSGGMVFFSSSNPTSVVRVDLREVTVDSDLMRTLAQFSEIEQLKLEATDLQPEACESLDKLPQLHSLSLDRTNVTDAHVARLPRQLSSLSLNGTAITDQSLLQLAAMNNLTSLEIVDTSVTADGLRRLEPSTSLQTLRIGENCITAEGAESLHRMRLQSADVVVSHDLGSRAHELLSKDAPPNIRGRHPKGWILWESDKAWSYTLAGVVQAVAAESNLSPEETARLLELLAPTNSWEPVKAEPPAPAFIRQISSKLPDGAPKIESIDEFLRELQKKGTGNNYGDVRHYARVKFTASDVPKLLAAMRSTPYSRDVGLFELGPFLLIQHGVEMPEVRTELERLLAHEEYFLRLTTICAFGYGGAQPFYSREEWVPSKAADAFAVPRLLRIWEHYPGGRYEACVVLAEMAHRRPEYANQVLPVIVDNLDVIRASQPGRRLSRIAEVAPEAAIAVVPKLRAMLADLDHKLSNDPEAVSSKDLDSLRRHREAVLESLSVTASASPELSQEIALDYLNRIQNGQQIGPFAPLLSPEHPEVTHRVVVELLDVPHATQWPPKPGQVVPAGELMSVAKKIRDWRTANAPPAAD